MYTEVGYFDELKNLVLEDKQSIGVGVDMRNRYPIRFVLFDNFRDCSLFVTFVQEEIGATVQSVDKWVDSDYPDLMITHTELAQRIEEHIKKENGADCVIAPFSELARFYDNETNKTFDALLKTIKAIEASSIAIEKHQRVYVPIVGLEGKMESFNKDTQSTIWRLKSEDKDLTYRLIITDKKTFGVHGLSQHYTIVNSMQEWLNIWKDANKQINPNIICTSHCIFANAIFAQPDNAFSFIVCNDAYDFLTEGLQLQLGNVSNIAGDKNNWEQLANCIDITHGFKFSSYVKGYFSMNDIENYKSFIKLWFDYPDQYHRWLLSCYYKQHKDDSDFIYNMLDKVTTLTGNDFIEQITLYLSEIDSEMQERLYCLQEAKRRGIILREAVQSTLANRLVAIAEKYNHTSAIKYFTGICQKEKELAVAWLGKKAINIEQIKSFLPDLYYYLSEPLGVSCNIPSWIAPYMKEYKNAKISNVYTQEIENQINNINKSDITFDQWYQEFSTTRTLLYGRGDIEVFYWIDGLGVEWIPLIKQIIHEKNNQNIFLNEVMIARALLPSTTNVNKADIQKLLPESQKLLKAGDLDNFAHQPTNVWPTSIIKEVELVREVIEDILAKYNGKKIAIISDHGLTYLSQLCTGLGLVGGESDHHGRLAVKSAGTWTSDSNYIKLEDGKTICALRHHSLCNKVPKGQGIHGGCTPEEVLVPIFIVSSYVADAEWSADILTIEVSGTNPTIDFKIKNAPSAHIPYVEYNGVRYALNQIGPDLFRSDAVAIDDNAHEVALVIGSITRIYKISVNAGAKEDDLFDF